MLSFAGGEGAGVGTALALYRSRQYPDREHPEKREKLQKFPPLPHPLEIGKNYRKMTEELQNYSRNVIFRYFFPISGVGQGREFL